MYQSLISNLKKILDSKESADKKLLKIQTLVDFAADLPQTPRQMPQMPQFAQQHQLLPSPVTVSSAPSETLIDAKKPMGAGPLIGVEDIK